MNPLDEMYLSIKPVAQRFTCSTRKIYRLVAEKEFPQPIRFGGSLKWPLSDLLTYEERLRNKGDNK